MSEEKLSERMVRYRAKHDLSQKDFAIVCGISLQTVNSVEKGLQKPSRLTEAKIKIVLEQEGE